LFFSEKNKKNVPNQTFAVCPESGLLQRLDIFLSGKFRHLSRSQIQKMINEGRITVDGQSRKASYRLRDGETVAVDLATPKPEDFQPEDLPVVFLYQDEHIAVLDKPSGQVVHPGAGHKKNTLVSALLFHVPELKGVGPKERAGIVHRLDKETSGIMVVAKTVPAFIELQRQFRKREVEKVYLGLVWGKMPQKTGKFSWPIGRHIRHGARMSLKTKKPREAETYFEVLKQLEEWTLLEIKPVTGRTHQIRVHMAASGHPIVGDLRYGRRKSTRQTSRLFLHAHRLAFTHPEKGERVEFCSPLAADLSAFLESISE
jgi:23S rRNA pseudouridine1911/1915/1917 synthase